MLHQSSAKQKMLEHFTAMVDIEIKPLAELPPIENDYSSPIPIYNYNSISYEDFFNKHMRKNLPCIIKNVGTDWEAYKKWADCNDKINFDYLKNQYGNLIVPVVDCKNISYDHQHSSEMMYSDFINCWRRKRANRLLYLKEWHLQKSEPNDKFYTVPKLFGSDWLNEYAQDKRLDDFMFVYMGPSGAWIPLYSDVFNSFSWSVNVAGMKKWILFPPGEEEKLKDHNNVILRFEPEKFKNKDLTYFEVIQKRGDAIFVPSGWYHQFETDIDTLSVNHNFINGCNIVKAWQALAKVVDSVKTEIEEIRDLEEFPSLCQNMIKNLYGMDCKSFADLITHIGEKRLAQLEGGSNIAFSDHALGKNHCLYDLKCIQEVTDLMSQHSTFVDNEYRITERFIVLRGSLSYIF